MIGEVEPLPDIAAPGAYPVFATVGRLPGYTFDTVAYASVVVSDAPTVSWQARTIVGVDGGTAGFTSAEGSELLGRMDVTANVAMVFDAFDSLTAHDNVITEVPIGEGLDMAIFTTGNGDGGYQVYVGLDADGKPTRFVMDFAIVHLGWPQAETSRASVARHSSSDSTRKCQDRGLTQGVRSAETGAVPRT